MLTSRPIPQFASDGERRNYEANIAATMATFSELSRGLDVNVKFSGYGSLQNTRVLAISLLLELVTDLFSTPLPLIPQGVLVRVYGAVRNLRSRRYSSQSCTRQPISETIC